MAYRGGRPRFTSFRNRRPRHDDEGTQANDAGESGMGGGKVKFKESFDDDRRSDRRGRPSHLRGRNIGLFYASRNAHGSKERSTRTHNYDEGHQAGGSGMRRERPPPHLRGKEIGLFYAKQSARKMKERSTRMEGGISISLDHSRQSQIKSLLSLISQQPAIKSSLSSPCSNLPPDIANFDDLTGEPMMEAGCSSNTSSIGKKIHLNQSTKKKCPKTVTEFGDRHQNVTSYDHISDSVFKRNFLRSITETIDKKINRLLQSHTNMEQIPSLDHKLKENLVQKKASSKAYKAMYEFRKKLPSYEMQEQILDLINKNQVVVISGETGCGKTTQVAQFILDHHILNGRGSLCRVICTQPRRISATSVAERVAAERDEELGSCSVGYQIRLDKKVAPKEGSILFCTTGILLQWMQTDPSLSDCSHVILDEIHERDTVSDFVITLLKDILPKRPDLKLILMSATLNADHFSRYFGSCPLINIPGFTYPVEELYLEDVLELTGFEFPPGKRFGDKRKRRDFEDFIEPHIRNLRHSKKYSSRTLRALENPESEEINIDLISQLVKYICASKPDGAILVFLPGWEQISKVNKCMTADRFFNSSRYLIIPLHSMMPTSVQRSVFDRPPAGVRKIILATNIAETSITIDDVVYVVDCGKIKMKNYDPVSNVQTLQPEWVSIANARQRRGRAGRVQPGVCFHLYSRAREMTLASYPLPEMLRTRLEGVILTAKILQLGQIRRFLSRVPDPPDSLAINHSLELLMLMNALDTSENLTPLGYHLAKLPVDPHTGKMLLMGALFSCVNPVFSVAASLGFKDPFMVPLGKEKEVDKRRVELSDGSKSDLLLLGDALMQWEEEEKEGKGFRFCNHYFLSSGTLFMLRDLKKQFAQLLYDMKFLESTNPAHHSSNLNSSNKSLIKAIVCAGLYPNVAYLQRCKPNVKKLTTPEDGAVYLHPKSVNDKEKSFESPFFVYHLKLKSKRILLHDTTMVYPLPLLFFGESVRFNAERNCNTISVGKHLHFRCEKSTAKIIMELREHMNALLEYRACHPGTIDWLNRTDPHAAVLRAIVELITYEDSGLSAQFDCLDSDDSGDDVLIEEVLEDLQQDF